MNRDDIIRMAREAGLYSGSPRTPSTGRIIEKRLERYAYLVAAHERKAIDDEYALRLQSDLENGVKWLNERATDEFKNKYPKLSEFGEWLYARGEK